MRSAKLVSAAGPIRLRPERAEDQAFRFGLFCRSRPDEWSALPIDPALLQGLMQHQFRAQTVSYRRQFPSAACDIIEHAGEPVGRIVTDRPGSQIHIVDQAIMPAYRNRGIGTAVMRALMSDAAASGIPVRLKAASSNDPSMRLYRRLGFVVREETPTYLDMVWRAVEPGVTVRIRSASASGQDHLSPRPVGRRAAPRSAANRPGWWDTVMDRQHR